MKFILTGLVFLAATTVFAGAIQNRVGLFYKIGEKGDKYLYKQETKVEITDDMNRKTDSKIVDPDGKILMRETATIENGMVIDQTMEQLQINEKYVLQVRDNKAHFQTFDIKDPANPKLKDENTVKIDANFFTGPSLEVFIKKNLAGFKAKKEQDVDFGIFELQKPISFDVNQTKKIFSDNKDFLPLKMEVSSTLLSFFADPLLLEVDPDTAMLRRYRGRTPVRYLKGKKLEPFDGDIYYELEK